MKAVVAGFVVEGATQVARSCLEASIQSWRLPLAESLPLTANPEGRPRMGNPADRTTGSSKNSSPQSSPLLVRAGLPCGSARIPPARISSTRGRKRLDASRCGEDCGEDWGATSNEQTANIPRPPGCTPPSSSSRVGRPEPDADETGLDGPTPRFTRTSRRRGAAVHDPNPAHFRRGGGRGSPHRALRGLRAHCRRRTRGRPHRPVLSGPGPGSRRICGGSSADSGGPERCVAPSRRTRPVRPGSVGTLPTGTATSAACVRAGWA
jgi:hypothetical protein